MRKLVESTYVSLDGMVSGSEFWGAQGQYRDDTHVDYAARLMEPAEALVLARATYEAFAETWPGQTGDLADRVNLTGSSSPRSSTTTTDDDLAQRRLPA